MTSHTRLSHPAPPPLLPFLKKKPLIDGCRDFFRRRESNDDDDDDGGGVDILSDLRMFSPPPLFVSSLSQTKVFSVPVRNFPRSGKQEKSGQNQ